MSDSIQVFVTIKLESFGNQLVRARPVGPFAKIQAVGASEQEASRRLQKRLAKTLSKALPSSYHTTDLPEEFDQWTAEVELRPQDRSVTWESPILVELECFRWKYSEDQAFILVPAVFCSLFGRWSDLTKEEVAAQAKVALNRFAQNRDLLQLHGYFANRSFDFRRLEIQVPLNAETEPNDKRKAERKKTATLRSSASDLTSQRLPNVYGMDVKAADLADYFQGEYPQSVLLVGPAGVGKTSLVHQFVRMRSQFQLGHRKVWTTSGARIVSGMSGLGMWQERCSKMIKQANDTNAILHLGSLFELMEAGKIDGSPGVASMIRQAISRRKLVAIAECTPEQLAVIERADPMLLRSFSKMNLDEPPAAWVQSVLRQAADHLFARESFSEQAIEELVRLHTRFATYSALPATALRLMRTMTDRHTQRWEKSPEKSAHDVARAFARQSGLPRFLVDDSMALDLDMVRKTLTSNVIGQSEPVELIVSLIATLKARLVRPGKPLASLMFIGPTGVGKTEMAKAIARLLYSDTKRMIRIDMSEYSSPWSVAKLIGKSGEGDGTLTSPIREQPFSVVLLDEFEKADPNVFDVLLQVLGEGRLTDSQGRLADFRNAVVIMTSNLGAESFREDGFGFGGSAANWNEHFRREVQRFVRPEFLGRIDRIVPFQALPREVVREIAQRELDLLTRRTGLRYSDSELRFQSSAVDLLCELGYQPKYGARPLRRAIEENVTVPLSNKIGELAKQESAWIFDLGVKAGQIHIEATEKRQAEESTKQQQAAVFDLWQALGAMARCAEHSSPLRKLENDMERKKRRLVIAGQKLKATEALSTRDKTHSPRAIRLKEEVVRLESEVESSRRIRQKLLDVTSQIRELRLDINLKWHEGEPLNATELKTSRQEHLSLLRQATEDVVKGRTDPSDHITLFVVGEGKGGLFQILWNAYCKLANLNSWTIDSYVVKLYNPLLDKESPEFRKRASEKKTSLTEFNEVPSLRLSHSTSSNEDASIACDLFRYSNDEFPKKVHDAEGFMLNVSGTGIATWLENEFGTYHFVSSSSAGAKKRRRLKVTISKERVKDWTLPQKWDEDLSMDPDPRRTFNLEGKVLYDSILGTSNSYAQGNESQALADCIRQEHEAALWRTIGYEGIPDASRLTAEPFEDSLS